MRIRMRVCTHQQRAKFIMNIRFRALERSASGSTSIKIRICVYARARVGVCVHRRLCMQEAFTSVRMRMRARVRMKTRIRVYMCTGMCL